MAGSSTVHTRVATQWQYGLNQKLSYNMLQLWYPRHSYVDYLSCVHMQSQVLEGQCLHFFAVSGSSASTSADQTERIVSTTMTSLSVCEHNHTVTKCVSWNVAPKPAKMYTRLQYCSLSTIVAGADCLFPSTTKLQTTVYCIRFNRNTILRWANARDYTGHIQLSDDSC